ncbi:unnamed protein product [marine sediment metagenome]|uniref:Uncharacterized protein n=1 Tax=marine sediment metagenome TaxID=412755 RepID=X0SP04_9ZZZZ
MALTFNPHHNAYSSEMKVAIPRICKHAKIQVAQIFFNENERWLGLVLFTGMECGYSVINLAGMFFMYDFKLRRAKVYELLIKAYLDILTIKEDNLFFNSLMKDIHSEQYYIAMNANIEKNKNGIINEYIKEFIDDGVAHIRYMLWKDFNIRAAEDVIETRIKNHSYE